MALINLFDSSDKIALSWLRVDFKRFPFLLSTESDNDDVCRVRAIDFAVGKSAEKRTRTLRSTLHRYGFNFRESGRD